MSTHAGGITHQTRRSHRASHRASRRGGFVAVYVAAGLFAFLGAAALAVDLSRQYAMKSEAQNAADAAALAGAKQLKQVKDSAGIMRLVPGAVVLARAEAERYAKLNGYDPARGAQVNVQDSPRDETGAVHPEWLRVTVNRPETLLFMRFFGRAYSRVEATATALHVQTDAVEATNDIGGLGTYGIAGGPVNLSLFGPDGLYNFGDPFSTLLRPDASGLGYEENLTTPDHPGGHKAGEAPAGVDFNLKFSPDIPAGSPVEVEVYDPDTFNSATGAAIDELRAGQNTTGPTPITPTKTKYSVYTDNGTPNDPSDDVPVVPPKTYGGDLADSATDMKWNNAFQFVPVAGQNYRLNIQTVEGASENGFDLRVGPPHADDMTQTQWSQTFGSGRTGGALATIDSKGRMPINFNASGYTSFGLGYVPPGATKVIIWKFDTDVGGNDIVYRLPDGSTRTGVLAGNGQWVKDEFDLTAEFPNDTYPGGNWSASYYAAPQDTSSWQMFYEGPKGRDPVNPTDDLKLVR